MHTAADPMQTGPTQNDLESTYNADISSSDLLLRQKPYGPVSVRVDQRFLAPRAVSLSVSIHSLCYGDRKVRAPPRAPSQTTLGSSPCPLPGATVRSGELQPRRRRSAASQPRKPREAKVVYVQLRCGGRRLLRRDTSLPRPRRAAPRLAALRQEACRPRSARRAAGSPAGEDDAAGRHAAGPHVRLQRRVDGRRRQRGGEVRGQRSVEVRSRGGAGAWRL